MNGDNQQWVVNPGLEFQLPGQTNKWQVTSTTYAQAQAQAQAQHHHQPEINRSHPISNSTSAGAGAGAGVAFSASTSANSHGDQQPYPTTHPTEKPEAQLKLGDSLTYSHSSLSTSLFSTPPSTPSCSPPTANISFQQPPHHRAVAPGVVVNGNSSALNTPRPGPTTTPATPVNMPTNDPAPSGALRSPPEGIFPSFEDLIGSIQRVAKDQGFGIVKLRASNYRDHKPTRYDLVCDRGGVKYNSTAKKRNPSTRKVDCPWRAKAVCEVQLGNQWRFQVQCDQHNHEPRVHSSNPGQENTPTAQSIRSLTNKMDRMSHEMTQAFDRIEQRLDGIEKRLETMESRMGAVEARMSSMETRGTGMDVPMDNMEMGGPMLDGPVM
ncbi:hypothetical protein Daesc_008128 [Daldinia eschscholtzii]|uniref:FAR1 domain-containing protein n=1 Tax=Daldinia eschscholtzii TaxID=292717 RepID=A0AAX6MBQ0_9PEZI